MLFGGNNMRRFAKAVLFSLIETAVVLIIVLLASAPHIRNMPSGSNGEAGIGPIHLAKVEKVASEGGGYTLTYNFYKSLLAVFGVCLAVEVVLLWKFSRHTTDNTMTTDDKP